MTSADKLIAAVVLAAASASAVHASVNLNDGSGSLTYAKETLATTDTVTASSVTYHVLNAPSPSLRLSFTAAVGRAFSAGDAFQVRFNLENMVFAGAVSPTLTIAGTTVATTKVLQAGGTSGDAAARFLVTVGSSESVASDAVMTLTVRAVGVRVDRPGEARVGVRLVGDATYATTENVTAFRVASGLREIVDPASPVVEFVDGFRSFVGKLVASVGSITFGPPPGLTGSNRFFSAVTSSPVTLTNMLSPTAGDSTVTFSGERGFTSDIFLSDEADCSTKDEEGVLNAGGDWQAVNLVNASGRHLCIEVDGVTSIPETTTAYQAAVTYGGIANAAFPPRFRPIAGTGLMLGKVVREGTTAHIPFMDTKGSVNFRIVITNRMNVPAPYKFEFSPPEGTSAVAGAEAEGTVPANSITFLRSTDVVTLTGVRTSTAASVTVGGSPEKIDIATINISRTDRSTDTVRY